MAEEVPTNPNTPNFNALEQETLNYWHENHIFEQSLEQTKDKSPYVFYDGPPFATGLPHYGSLLPSVIKDAIPRYQTMRGHYVRRRWGWDCHGLPIENLVEKKLGISGKKQIEELGVEKFNQTCRENVLNLAHEWGKTIDRIARWVDFENSYKTMDTSFQESVWWALKQLWEKQLIYEDRKVLLYCSRCETPISNFEVAMDNSYREITENSVYVKFKLLPHQRILDFLLDDATYVLAWTTTPWTLPGNTALNIGPEIQYVLVDQGGVKYIVAKDRLGILDGEYEIVRELSARSLEGLQYEPVFPEFAQRLTSVPRVTPEQMQRLHHIYSENYVTTTDGTGIVHNAAMYGEEDYAAAKQRNIPRVDMLDHKGQYLPIAPDFLHGVFFKDADKMVLHQLTERGLVYKVQSYTHSYPHCYRCGTPLFYNAVPAWFINIQKIKPELVKNNEAVNWYPGHLKHGRFQQGIENAPDWNISRNRYWATALPFWKCTGTGCREVSCVGSISELVRRSVNFANVYPNFEFLISNFETNPNFQIPKEQLEQLDLHKPYIDAVLLRCTACGNNMRRIPEVVDCWVESGSMPFAELHYPFEKSGSTSMEDFRNRFPADFVVEYIPQTRAWFYVMHVLSTILFGQSPFRNVMTTGTILGEDGTKMSKSKGNYPDPHVVIERYGADALRFYMLASPVTSGEDVSFSEAGVKDVYQKVNMLLYNVLSFYRMYQKEQISNFEFRISNTRHVLDVWILNRLQQLIQSVTQHMEKYNTVKACKEVVDFINDLSTWYVRRSRDRIKNGGEDGTKALDVLGFVLSSLARVLAPFSPYISDYVYRTVTGEPSVHLSAWPVVAQPVDERALTQMEVVREVVSLALQARKVAKISVRQPLAGVGYALRSEAQLSYDHELLILDELNVKGIVEFASLQDKAQLHHTVQSAVGAGTVSEVLLDLEITDELRVEGYGREIERAVQDLRKKSGLTVGDTINLYYNTQDPELERAVTQLIDTKKLGTQNIMTDPEIEADNETQLDIAGKAIWLGIVRT